MKRLLFALSLILGPLAAHAQNVVITQQQLPTSSFFYNTNQNGGTGATVIASIKHLGGPASPPMGGLAATNSVVANSTNKAMWITPIDLGFYDNGSLFITSSTVSNVWATNWLFLYPCPDGCNPDTNNYVTLGPFTNNVLFTNLEVFTNLSMSNGPMGPGGPRYWQLGWGIQGTNTGTNSYAQVFVRRPIRIIEQQ